LSGRGILQNPEVKNKGVFLAKKSLRKLTVPREFKLTGVLTQPARVIPEKPRQLSEADRLYAMLEQKGILDIDKDEQPILNEKLIKNYDQAMKLTDFNEEEEAKVEVKEVQEPTQMTLDLQSDFFFSRSSSLNTVSSRQRKLKNLMGINGNNYSKVIEKARNKVMKNPRPF
jgi:hypothetical protein